MAELFAVFGNKGLFRSGLIFSELVCGHGKANIRLSVKSRNNFRFGKIEQGFGFLHNDNRFTAQLVGGLIEAAAYFKRVVFGVCNNQHALAFFKRAYVADDYKSRLFNFFLYFVVHAHSIH